YLYFNFLFLLFFFFIFFYSSLPLRDLHSFPTRRSSDLRCGMAIAQRIKVTPGITGLSGPRVHIDGPVWHLDVGSSHPGAGVGPKDRKSTRLNSSHDQISYAVFCLKKKKKKQNKK